jgi:hypothetical protein
MPQGGYWKCVRFDAEILEHPVEVVDRICLLFVQGSELLNESFVERRFKLDQGVPRDRIWERATLHERPQFIQAVSMARVRRSSETETRTRVNIQSGSRQSTKAALES